jgi:NADPH-dependent ferric siderophore reductase
LTAPAVIGSVLETQPLGRRLQRVVIHAPGLRHLRLPPSADTSLGVYFATSDDGAAIGRSYTAREHDPSRDRITVDVVLHGDAMGTRWATNASVGDRVELAHAKSWYQPPERANGFLLVADLAGLPAIAGLMERHTPTGTTVIVEVLDDDDLHYLPTQSSIELITSVGTGNGVTDSALARLVAENLAIDERGYCWFAGEASEARAVRKFLRHDCRWAIDQMDTVGYWRRDADEWARRFSPHGPHMYAVYEEAVAAGKSEKTALEEFDEALEGIGL